MGQRRCRRFAHTIVENVEADHRGASRIGKPSTVLFVSLSGWLTRSGQSSPAARS